MKPALTRQACRLAAKQMIGYAGARARQPWLNYNQEVDPARAAHRSIRRVLGRPFITNLIDRAFWDRSPKLYALMWYPPNWYEMRKPYLRPNFRFRPGSGDEEAWPSADWTRYTSRPVNFASVRWDSVPNACPACRGTGRTTTDAYRTILHGVGEPCPLCQGAGVR